VALLFKSHSLLKARGEIVLRVIPLLTTTCPTQLLATM